MTNPRIALPSSPIDEISTERVIIPDSDGRLQFAGKQQKYGMVIKRVIDAFGSAALLLLLSPIFLVSVCLIWYIDGTPIIYRRRVVGVAGELFDAYKFRTMTRDADAMLTTNVALREAFTRKFKLRSDPRVTRLGRWLRKYSLDELPQLLNVLRGQMSLVGPRMITLDELQKYTPYDGLLLTVKPGLTGYWQVRGRQEVSYAKRVEMDIYYITNWNLFLDLKILLLTPAKVIKSEGAY
jgi:lipopolysaccharide/colanic/teichoic acid biosynthesis glycosyltransferase